MEPILFLVHRSPFPPDKGDKVRSYHLLKFLASRYRVHLGAFVDDPADLAFVPRLGEFCESYKVARIHPTLARLRSLPGFWSGKPLTLGYYHDASLMRWVRATVRQQHIKKAVVFCSAMAQYVSGIAGLRVVVDFVDIDSEKWRLYGQYRSWPISAIFKREADHLLEYERAVARGAAASVFVTANEAALFRRLAPECASRVCHAQNGVDTQFFSPQVEFSSPYQPDEQAIVFTGAMDYWPNVDAVCWFAREVLPLIAADRPRAKFYIVGM